MTSPVISTYTVDGEMGPTPHNIDTTERVYDGSLYNIIVPWAALPGTQIQAGVSGRIAVGAFPVVLRVRGGKVPPRNTTDVAVIGDIWFETTLPANATTDLGALGALVDKPSNGPSGTFALSNIQITVRAVGGTSNCVFTGLVLTIVPDAAGVGQGILLNSGASALVAYYEWVLDFDQFETCSNLMVGVAAQCGHPDQANPVALTMSVRVGGTTGAQNGTILLSVTDNDLPPAIPVLWDRLLGGYGGAPNVFSGPQLVKLTIESTSRGAFHPGVIIREL